VRVKQNLNDKSSEYIEANILKANPEGMQPCHTVPEVDQVVVAKEVPKYREIEFLNGRDPGYPLEFHYHSKTHPLKHYTLYHGQKKMLPEEVIDHLENCAERQYAYRIGPNGQPEMYVKGLKYVFRCKTVNQSRVA
jgi:hypothetical protein